MAVKKATAPAEAPAKPVKATCATCNHAASFHRDGAKCFVGGCSCKKLVQKKAPAKKK